LGGAPSGGRGDGGKLALKKAIRTGGTRDRTVIYNLGVVNPKKQTAHTAPESQTGGDNKNSKGGGLKKTLSEMMKSSERGTESGQWLESQGMEPHASICV